VQGVSYCTTDCSNNQGISLLSTMYKILSHNLLSSLTLYAEEIIGDILT